MENQLPEEIKNLPQEQKLKYLKNILENFRYQEEMHHTLSSNGQFVYKPLHPSILQMHDWAFDPIFLKAMNDGDFSGILKKVNDNLYIFKFLSTQFCRMMIEEKENFEKFSSEEHIKINRPNSMNKYGAILDEFGFGNLLNDWMIKIVKPMGIKLFPEFGSDTLDNHHGFLVEYEMGKDTNLGFHVDDSEVTLNVCLGKNFEGGSLFFRGVRCDDHQQTSWTKEEEIEFFHEPGVALIHAGRHRHGANPITKGHRINLILWCRSTEWRKERSKKGDHPSWCGIKNIETKQ